MSKFRIPNHPRILRGLRTMSPAVLALALLVLVWRLISAAPAADCANPNAPGVINTDTTLSGDLYADSDILVQSGAVLTLTAGTQLTMCGEYDLRLSSIEGSSLMALGTHGQPIVIRADVTGTHWGRIYYLANAGPVVTSTLQHLTLINGGGNDPAAEIGALHVYATTSSGTLGVNPVIDHLTVIDSGAYGIYVRVDDQDPTPIAMTNLTVTGSARHPLLLYASAVGGLGKDNSFTGNMTDTIEVRIGGSLGGIVRQTQTWRSQPIPYQLISDNPNKGMLIGGPDNPILTIEPGTTLLMPEDGYFKVNAGGLIAEGTPTQPITFTRASSALPWGRIYFEANTDPSSRLSYVNLLGAGGPDGSLAIWDVELGMVLSNLTITDNPNSAGVFTRSPFILLRDSRIEDNQIGVHFDLGGGGQLRRNIIQNNPGGGVLVTSNNPDTCVDAIANYWGSSDGPADSSNVKDACYSTATNAGSGDSVSDDVLYKPWLSGETSILDDRSSLSPDPFWVPADGVHTATLTITARDGLGVPLSDKEILVETTLGNLQQPAELTDENGITTAVISSTQVGNAILTAYNVTDGRSMAAIGAVHFWQGGEETAGLIDPGGAPYVAPQLIVEGMPFEVGSPIGFRVPMQNSNLDPVAVTVTYAASQVPNIGTPYGTVASTTRTLQPGETWDAFSTWVPQASGHRCVLATLEVDFLSGLQVLDFLGNTTVGPLQQNTDIGPGPCNNLDPKQLVPRFLSAGVPIAKIINHMGKALGQAYLVRECLDGALAVSSTSQFVDTSNGGQIYGLVVVPPVYTPPPLPPGDGVTPEQAAAATAVGDIAAELAGLNAALVETNNRRAAAWLAGKMGAVTTQILAFRGFQVAYAAKLSELGDALQELLALTEGAGTEDVTFMPQDYEVYLNQLQTVGYDPKTVSFHQQFGLTAELIDQMLDAEIAEIISWSWLPISFYDILHDLEAEVLTLSSELISHYGSNQAQAASLSSNLPKTFFVDTMMMDFLVGNPMNSQETLNLLIRPVDIPVGWTYYLSNPAPILDPGETITVTLTLEPDAPMLENTHVRLAVEGFINGEYISGILFNQQIPALSGDFLYLPIITKE